MNGIKKAYYFHREERANNTEAEVAVFPTGCLSIQIPNRMVDGKMLENKEYVYFFTDDLNYMSDKKYIGVLREKESPFGYLGMVNVENVVRRVFEDLGEGGERN